MPFASPDHCAALHGTSYEHRMWQHAQQQRPEHRLRDYLECTQAMTIIAATLLTCGRVPSKHVEVASHGHHAVTISTARRGPRDPWRIELLPLLLCRREPKELIRVICTVHHAHNSVNLNSHDDSTLCCRLCRGPGAPSASQCVYADRRPRCDSRFQERGDVPSRVTRLWFYTVRHLARAQDVATRTAAARGASPKRSIWHADDDHHRGDPPHLWASLLHCRHHLPNLS